MIGIPDWSNEPLSNPEEIAAKNAAIDAEIAASHAKYDYHYTGTVNVWTEDGIVNSGEQQALAEFEQVPSYVERFKTGKASE